MKIIVMTIGKKHDKNLAAAIADYETRLKPFCGFSWHIIPASDIENESIAIVKAVDGIDLVFLLDERGTSFSSPQLAESIERAQNTSVKKIAVIIGGAYGVNRSVIDRANVTLSLSRLVLPHQIVRLIIVEQIYRSYAILSGSSYHHE